MLWVDYKKLPQVWDLAKPVILVEGVALRNTFCIADCVLRVGIIHPLVASSSIHFTIGWELFLDFSSTMRAAEQHGEVCQVKCCSSSNARLCSSPPFPLCWRCSKGLAGQTRLAAALWWWWWSWKCLWSSWGRYIDTDMLYDCNTGQTWLAAGPGRWW